MPSFRATFGLTRSIGGWEEGESSSWSRFFWTGRVVRLTPGQSGWLGAAAVGSIPALALSLFLQCLYFFSFFNVYIYLFKLFVQLPFSSLSCAGLSWLPLPLVSFPSFSLLPTPNRPCQSERSSKARHKADSFEPAEWSERLTPGQSGWLGAAAVGSIPALALSLFLQCLYFLLLLPQKNHLIWGSAIPAYFDRFFFETPTKCGLPIQTLYIIPC